MQWHLNRSKWTSLWSKTTRAGGVALALVALSASPGFAQSEPDNGTPFYDDIFSLSTSTTTTAVIVGVVLLTVTLVNDSSAALETYLHENGALVQHDLYTGGGAATSDLAALFGVPTSEHEAFAALLFEERDALAPLCDSVVRGEASGVSARAFASRVLASMAQHPLLSRHLPQLAS